MKKKNIKGAGRKPQFGETKKRKQIAFTPKQWELIDRKKGKMPYNAYFLQLIQTNDLEKTVNSN